MRARFEFSAVEEGWDCVDVGWRDQNGSSFKVGSSSVETELER